MKNLVVRAITGSLYVGALVSSILLGSYSFAPLFALMTATALCEFYTITDNKKNITLAHVGNVLGGVLLFVTLYLLASGLTSFSSMQLLSPYLAYFIFTMATQLYGRCENPLLNWANSFFGQLYIALPLGLLSYIAYAKGAYSAPLLLGFFTFIWMSDTGAYMVGITFGKHRLFERVSPKKSWEGFFGGIFFALLTALLFARYTHNVMTPMQWVGFAAVVSLASTWGDLCESLLKRTLNVKDSGNILPGHGGILDRIDSVLIAAPAAVIYLALFL